MRKILLYGCLCWLLACQKAPSSSNSLLPLAVGNQWRYQVTYYDSTLAVPLYQVDTVTLACTETTVKNSQTYYKVEQVSANSAPTVYGTGEFYWKDGIAYQYVSQHPNGQEKQIFLKHNLKVGDAWDYSVPYYSHQHKVITVDTSLHLLGTTYGEVALVNYSIAAYTNGGNGGALSQNYYQYSIGLVQEIKKEYGVPRGHYAQLIDYTLQ